MFEIISPASELFEAGAHFNSKIYLTHPKKCGSCGKCNAAKHCSCYTVFYCDEECQAKDWREHQETCSFTLKDKISEEKDPFQLTLLYLKFAHFCLRSGNFDDSMENSKKAYIHAVQIRKRIIDGNDLSGDSSEDEVMSECIIDLTLAEILTLMGECYFNQGQIQQSLTVYGISLDLRRKQLGDYDPSTVWTLSEVVISRLCLRNFDTASQNANVETASSNANLMFTIAEQNKDNDSISKKERNIMMALAEYNLGLVHEHRGNDDEAMDHYCRAKIIFNQEKKKDWYDTRRSVKCLLRIAEFYKKKERFEDALKIFCIAQVGLKLNCVINHPELCFILFDVAVIFKNFPDGCDKAYKITRKAMKMLARFFGPDDVRNAPGLQLLASIMHLKGKYVEAIYLHLRAIKLVEENTLMYQDQLPIWYFRLSSAYEEIKSFDKMEEVLVKGLSTCQRSELRAMLEVNLQHCRDLQNA